MSKPTHDKGHILHLVISLSLSITDLQTDDFCLTDHKPVLFISVLNTPMVDSIPCGCKIHSVNSYIAILYADVFTSDACPIMSSLLDLSVDEQLFYFNTLCSNVLDSVDPFKMKKFKLQVKPWLNNATRTSRQEWRKAERNWKKDKRDMRDCGKLSVLSQDG